MLGLAQYPVGKQLLDSSIRAYSLEIRQQDSLQFVKYLDQLVLTNDPDTLKRLCSRIENKTSNYHWIKDNSNRIINKIVRLYYKDPFYAELLSLTNLQDSVKSSILNNKQNNIIVAKARLGDTTSINRCIEWYKLQLNANGLSYCHGKLSLEIGRILELNQPQLLPIIFKDMESDRIIIQNESRGDDIYYTIPYAFVMALREMYPYEPIFNERYMYQFLESSEPSRVNPEVKEYFKQVEKFIWDKYKIKVKIKTPYLVSGWRDYGYF